MITNDQKMSGSEADALDKLYAGKTPTKQQQPKYRPLQQDGIKAVRPSATSAKTGGVLVAKNNVSKVSVHPWLRYFARMFDYFLVAIIIGLLLGIFVPSVMETNSLALTLMLIFLWIFIESALMSTWGTTPGKWLFNINIQTIAGTKPDFSSALNRSFSVWFKGLGMGLPVVSLFTLIGSYRNLTAKGTTSWDENNFIVTHKDIGGGRIVAIIGFIIIYVLLAVASAQYD